MKTNALQKRSWVCPVCFCFSSAYVFSCLVIQGGHNRTVFDGIFSQSYLLCSKLTLDLFLFHLCSCTTRTKLPKCFQCKKIRYRSKDSAKKDRFEFGGDHSFSLTSPTSWAANIGWCHTYSPMPCESSPSVIPIGSSLFHRIFGLGHQQVDPHWHRDRHK